MEAANRWITAQSTCMFAMPSEACLSMPALNSPCRVLPALSRLYQGGNEDVLYTPPRAFSPASASPPTVIAAHQFQTSIFTASFRQLVEIVGHRGAYCQLGGDPGGPETQKVVREGHEARRIVAESPSEIHWPGQMCGRVMTCLDNFGVGCRKVLETEHRLRQDILPREWLLHDNEHLNMVHPIAP